LAFILKIITRAANVETHRTAMHFASPLIA
jgi:hypothetical protein